MDDEGREKLRGSDQGSRYAKKYDSWGDVGDKIGVEKASDWDISC